jgi:glucose dehydrogenase
MIRNSYTRICTLVIVATLTAWIASGRQPGKVDTSALRNAGKNGDEWLSYGRDYAETHFSPLRQIDTTNVKRVWSNYSCGAAIVLQ